MTSIDIVTGFLGAGKTTFIKRYASALLQANMKIAIIENEFGRAGTDSAFLRREFSSVSEVSGGCICCGMKADFCLLLTRLADGGAYDRIIVEPSGIFDPDDFFDVLDSVTARTDARAGAFIAVVDPLALESENSLIADMIRRQTLCAGAVFVSKLESTDDTIRDKLIGIGIRGDMPICARSWTFLTADEWLAVSSYEAIRIPHKRIIQDHSSMFQCAALYPTRMFTREELSKLMEKIIYGECGEIIRAKGYLNSESGSCFVNCTNKNISVSEAAREATGVNFIGWNIRRNRISALLR